MLGGEDEARLLYSIEAKNFCNSAVKRHPENILGWITTGVLYTEILEYEIALKYFYKGLELDPNNLKIHSSLATTHSRIGNIGKSVEHMRRAIEMAPTAENLHSQGILRSVAYSNDQLSKISHINASILTAKNRVTKECPNGHVLQFGWENIPMDNKWKIQVTGVHQSDGVVFGAEARLPNTAIARGNGTHLERLQWKDRDVVIVKLQAVHLEGDTGIFSHPQTCTAFTGGHKELSRVSDFPPPPPFFPLPVTVGENTRTDSRGDAEAMEGKHIEKDNHRNQLSVTFFFLAARDRGTVKLFEAFETVQYFVFLSRPPPHDSVIFFFKFRLTKWK
eukprot:TRINITY_DN4333_c0_g1_i6.p1 TRINITY_DN4333_c0_g1~~TRINITY_DN4333_c0_g1_i6.p1  ORF type:complete len:334 (-),score=47.75 TRINITY_DN4333_c0_g1_i6:998-1999(-)